MRKLLLFVLLIGCSEYLFSQDIVSDTLIPKTSVGIGISWFDSWHHRPRLSAGEPAVFALAPLYLTFQTPIKSNLYFNAGILFPTKENNLYWNAVTAKVGLTRKWKMQKNIYLTPSLSVYEYHVFNSTKHDKILPVDVLSIGTSVEFEFRPAHRFSYTLCLGEVSYGIAYLPGMANPAAYFQIHNLIGFGIHYNF